MANSSVDSTARQSSDQNADDIDLLEGQVQAAQATATAAQSSAATADAKADTNAADIVTVSGDVTSRTAGYHVSTSGDDANNGLSPSSPMQTIAAAVALVQPGGQVLLKAGDTFRENINLTGKERVTVSRYGGGARPRVSGRDVVTAFTAASGSTYNFTIDLPEGPTNRAYVGVFEDGVRLREYRISADGITDNAGVIAAVEANPGSFGFLSWSTNPTSGETGGWAAGSKTYIVHASDSGNPASNGKVYEAYSRQNVLQLFANTVKDVVFFAGWRHEVGDLNDGTIENCAFIDVARHGTLPPNRIAIKDTMVAGSNPQYPGGMFHLQAVTASTTEPIVTYENITAIGDDGTFSQQGIYNHGTVDPTARIEGFRIVGAHVENAFTPFEFSVADFTDISGLYAKNFTNAGGSLGTVARLEDCTWLSTTTQATARRQFNITESRDVTFVNPYLDIIENSLFRRETGQNTGSISIDGGTFILRPAPISSDLSGLCLLESNNTNSIAKFHLTNSIVYANGPLVSRASAVTDLNIDNVLLIGHGRVGDGTITIGGSSTSLDETAGVGRVIRISDSKVIASDTPGALELRKGAYSPGDEIFMAAVGSNFADNPRAYVLVGDAIYTTSGQNLRTSMTRRAEPSGLMRAVCLSGDKAVVVGDDGEIWRSTNSFVSAWSEVTGTGITETLRACAGRSTGVVIAVGDGGVIYRSEDFGATWANITSPTSRTMRACVGNGDTWVAAGDEGRVITSTDNGLNWTEATVGSTAHYALARFNSLYILGSEPSLNTTSLTSNIRTSPDAVTWTTGDNGVPNRVSAFAATPEGLMASLYQTSESSAASIMTSTDGTTWTVEEYEFPFEVTGLAASGATNRFEQRPLIAVGESSFIGVRRQIGQAWDIRRASTAFAENAATGKQQILSKLL